MCYPNNIGVLFLHREVIMVIKNKNSGFTLIELIFVVAIIGFIITLGLSYMAKLAERTKEKTASLQIQQILQAAMTYYVNNKAWPSNGRTTNAGVFANYIPAISRLKTNPWGVNDYWWTVQTSGGKLFTVSTTVPDSNTAARIASSLPNATNSGTTVNSQITIPGQAQEVKRGYIMKAGEFDRIKMSSSDLTAYSYKVVLTAAEAANCDGAVKVMPIIKSFQIEADNLADFRIHNWQIAVVSGLCNTLPAPDGGNNCGHTQSKRDYCVCMSVKGDKSGVAKKMFPDEVFLTYMVLCMPP